MHLVDDWGNVLRKAWSVRLNVLAAILSGAVVAIPYMAPEYPSLPFAAVAFALNVAAPLARIVAQKGMRNADD